MNTFERDADLYRIMQRQAAGHGPDPQPDEPGNDGNQPLVDPPDEGEDEAEGDEGEGTEG